jgi:hypothetical protein
MSCEKLGYLVTLGQPVQKSAVIQLSVRFRQGTDRTGSGQCTETSKRLGWGSLVKADGVMSHVWSGHGSNCTRVVALGTSRLCGVSA